MAVGDGGREAYTAIERGGLLSHEIRVAEAETVASVEGNMTLSAMRGPHSAEVKDPITLRRDRAGTWEISRPIVGASVARIGKARSRTQ